MNETNQSQMNQFLMPASVIFAGILIAGAVIWNNQNPAPVGQIQQQGNTQGTKPAIAVDIKKVNVTGLPYIGNQNAPVAIAYWADYQCPYCKKFDLETMPQLLKDYINTGKAKLVFKDFQFLGPDSETAGLYGRAVWELYPSQYAAWHEAMFVAQDAEHSGFGDEPSIQALTKTISGIDAAKVTAAVKANSAKYKTAIEADRAEAQQFGINATPSFVIGTQVIAGAQPFANFKSVIDPLLK